MQAQVSHIVVFLIVVTALIIVMGAFIIMMLYLYTRRQNIFKSEMEQLKLDHAKTIMSTKLEIQEETFHNISREIHDNINLSLTLCKLNLNTLNWADNQAMRQKIDFSIELLGKSIVELSDISKSLNSDIILQSGLTKAVEDEVLRIQKIGVIKFEWLLLGNPIYMDSQKELIIFRIIQEALNNIIKHSEATYARLELNYLDTRVVVKISDNGKGFDIHKLRTNGNAGFKNMQARIKMLKGTMNVKSYPHTITTLLFTIPYL